MAIAVANGWGGVNSGPGSYIILMCKRLMQREREGVRSAFCCGIISYGVKSKYSKESALIALHMHVYMCVYVCVACVLNAEGLFCAIEHNVLEFNLTADSRTKHRETSGRTDGRLAREQRLATLWRIGYCFDSVVALL